MEGGTGGPRVVVSIHDVAPSTIDGTRWLIARLDTIAARPRVLKVIPLEGGNDDLRAHADLVALLTAEQKQGSEIVQHGLTHRSEGPLGGRAIDRIRGRVFAARAAEFLALDDAEARLRVERGSAILADVDLRSAGFCPPGWLARPGLERILGELGFRYLITLGWIVDLRRHRRLRIPAVGYMGAGATQERLVAIERRLVLAAGGQRRTLRIFFHPQGASRSRACASALRSLEALVAHRQCLTYGDVLDG